MIDWLNRVLWHVSNISGIYKLHVYDSSRKLSLSLPLPLYLSLPPPLSLIFIHMRFVHGVKSSQLNLFSDNAVIFNKLSLLMMWWAVDGVRYVAGICFSFVRAIQITRYVLNPVNWTFLLTSSFSVFSEVFAWLRPYLYGTMMLIHQIRNRGSNLICCILYSILPIRRKSQGMYQMMHFVNWCKL